MLELRDQPALRVGLDLELVDVELELRLRIERAPTAELVLAEPLHLLAHREVAVPLVEVDHLLADRRR
jgi:hypothetical protein